MTEQTYAQKNRSYGQAAQQAAEARSVQIVFEGIGTLRLPPKEDLAFLAGIGLIAAAGVIEWPLAGIVAVGHLIAHAGHNETLRQFGQALESA